MTSTQEFIDESKMAYDKPSGTDAATSTSLQVIIGAIIVVIAIVLVLTAIKPDSVYSYMAVAGASLKDSTNATMKTLRISVEIQTVLMLVGIVMAAVFWNMFGKSVKYLGEAVFGVVAVLTLALLIFRTLSATYLNYFFWLLTLLYLIICVLAGACAVRSIIYKKDKITGALAMVVAVIFLFASTGAATMGVNAISGTAAQQVIDEMHQQVSELQ